MDNINEQTFVEKVEEAKKRIESWPEWKKQLYKNSSVSNTNSEAGSIVSKIDESSFKSRIIDSFKF